MRSDARFQYGLSAYLDAGMSAGAARRSVGSRRATVDQLHSRCVLDRRSAATSSPARVELGPDRWTLSPRQEIFIADLKRGLMKEVKASPEGRVRGAGGAAGSAGQRTAFGRGPRSSSRPDRLRQPPRRVAGFVSRM